MLILCGIATVLLIAINGLIWAGKIGAGQMEQEETEEEGPKVRNLEYLGVQNDAAVWQAEQGQARNSGGSILSQLTGINGSSPKCMNSDLAV